MKGEDSVRDLDFSDVFGGPPRQLWMRGKKVVEEEEELKDKPIFGGNNVVRRRHLHGDHFFDDIFRGDCSTWRTHPHRFRSLKETNGGANEIKYEVHQSNRYHSTANVRGDFAKVFSKETDSSLKSDIKKRSQSCRWMSDQKVIENLRKVELEQCIQTKTPSYAKFMRSDSKIIVENLDDSFEDLFEEAWDHFNNIAPL